MQAGNVSLRLVNGITTYKVFGYALGCINQYGVECVELRPADCEKGPVMIVPKCNVESLIVEY
jgi:hypothetical protein